MFIVCACVRVCVCACVRVIPGNKGAVRGIRLLHGFRRRRTGAHKGRSEFRDRVEGGQVMK